MLFLVSFDCNQPEVFHIQNICSRICAGCIKSNLSNWLKYTNIGILKKIGCKELLNMLVFSQGGSSAAGASLLLPHPANKDTAIVAHNNALTSFFFINFTSLFIRKFRSSYIIPDQWTDRLSELERLLCRFERYRPLQLAARQEPCSRRRRRRRIWYSLRSWRIWNYLQWCNSSLSLNS